MVSTQYLSYCVQSTEYVRFDASMLNVVVWARGLLSLRPSQSIASQPPRFGIATSYGPPSPPSPLSPLHTIAAGLCTCITPHSVVKMSMHRTSRVNCTGRAEYGLACSGGTGVGMWCAEVRWE